MTDRQSAKRIALRYFNGMEDCKRGQFASCIADYSAYDYEFRGVHPFNELKGTDAVATTVWEPLAGAFSRLQRRQNVFMAGPNLKDASMWVTSMGKFLGLFDNDWLGIPSTGKIALIPYCEFLRIENDRIAESALWVDIISVMKQADIEPLPLQTGAEIVFPGPRTGDGLLFEKQDDIESQRALDLIMEMCNDLVNDDMQSPGEMLRKTWHEDMLWFGPSGIGSTYTIDRYQQQHQGPFRAGLKDIEFNGHVMEHAEGCYGGWFGWPNLRMNQGDGFLGLPSSETRTEMRVVDIYRREGDTLVENWILIDFLHYLKLLGVDVLERCRSISRT